MILTRQFLDHIGVNLDEESYALLADHFETTLHERVVNEIVAELSPQQVETLAHMQQTNDETIHEWLIQNVPELPEIIQDEIDILLGEVAADSEKL